MTVNSIVSAMPRSKSSQKVADFESSPSRYCNIPCDEAMKSTGMCTCDHIAHCRQQSLAGVSLSGLAAHVKQKAKDLTK